MSKENEAPEVGESIPIGGDSSKSESEGTPSPVDRPIERPRRRKSLGRKLAEIQDKISAGTATDDEKREYEENYRKRSERSSEKPPETSVKEEKPKASWRAKYGDVDGRERICTTLASYWSQGLINLCRYIEKNDPDGDVVGVDMLDPDKRAEFNGVLVLACDDLLPPGFKASPALIAAGDTTFKVVQAANIARKKNAGIQTKRAPEKSREERIEEERQRAAKVNPIVEEPEPENKPEPEPKASRIPVDREGIKAV